MTFNPFRWSFRAQCLSGFAICVALIGFAIYSQLQWGLEPCPLCIFQRIAFTALGLVFLIAGLHAPRGAVGRGVYGGLGFLAAAVGIGIAGRHVWLQLYPPPIPACGAPLDFMRETMSTASVIRKVLTGTGRLRQRRLDLPRPVDAGMEPDLVRPAGRARPLRGIPPALNGLVRNRCGGGRSGR